MTIHVKLAGISAEQSRRIADQLREIQLKLHGGEFDNFRAAILCGAGALVLIAELVELQGDVGVDSHEPTSADLAESLGRGSRT